jgi:putative intracellular protease/amidase
MVLTSHNQSDGGEETGLHAEDFADPYYIFADAGYDVVLTSPAGGMPPVRRGSRALHLPSQSAVRLRSDHVTRNLLADTLELSQVFAEDFQGAYYAAGPGALFDLATSLPCRALTLGLVERGVPICFVGEATCLLPHMTLADGTRLIEGKLVTGMTTTEQSSISGQVSEIALVEDEFRRVAGAYSCSRPWTPHVCTDGLLITGQNWMSGPEAATRLLGRVKG